MSKKLNLHNIIRFFVAPAIGFLDVFFGIAMICGKQYSMVNISLYSFYTALPFIDSICGLLLFVTGGLFVWTTASLARGEKKGIKILKVALLLQSLIPVAYMFFSGLYWKQVQAHTWNTGRILKAAIPFVLLLICIGYYRKDKVNFTK